MAGDVASVWTGAATASVGVVLGFGLNLWRDAIERARERRGHWLALRRDVIACGAAAKGYLDGGVKVPTGRSPTKAYDVGFAVLTSAELIDEGDILLIRQFFDGALAFNFALDEAQDAIGENSANVEREVKRAMVKARKLLAGTTPEGEPMRHDRVLAIINRHLQAKTGFRALFWK